MPTETAEGKGVPQPGGTQEPEVEGLSIAGYSRPATAFLITRTEPIHQIHLHRYFPSHLLHNFQRNMLP